MQAQGGLPQPGEIVFLQELCRSDTDKKSVRVIGRLTNHDFRACSAVITDVTQTYTVKVDTTLIEPFNYMRDSLVQLIGEMERLDRSGDRILRARVVSIVDGMDMNLYQRVVQAQRQYFNKRQTILHI
ncbi:CST complex subunit TEN1 [Lingula anatina]|uniref:CST complex subunit TEN1 n=1 Tax=Lingula anatina TaxID=7574 RepID=A0A1S3KF94_LINAN|nr:CST complex subunit TEN1 [Lingula anatina]|eukprot:XP_013420911.1 CST complex subunit TEN1 [Lingula anatina]